MNQDIIAMSQQELQRLPVIASVLTKRITQAEAARCLDITERQIRRLKQRLKQNGPKGLIHQGRGRPSNHRLSEVFRNRVMELIRQRYPDFGPTLVSEKLSELHRIRLSDETIRQWMRQSGLQAGHRRPRPHRQWRQRSACYGQMVQMDGSHHDWLEDRGPRFVLMGYADDATGRAYARFYPSEDLPAAFDSFKRYCHLYGIPQSVYLDKHTIYRSPKEPTVEEQLNGKDPQSQFERAMEELGVHVIHANSPQAKGRVERLFRTLQDRLTKEMRLANIRTLKEANLFLRNFLQAYNRRFSRSARQPGNLHRTIHPGTRLNQVLCVKEHRVVANDGTIQINSQRLQLRPNGLGSLARKAVTITISPKGKMHVLHNDKQLTYSVLPIKVLQPKPRPKTPVRLKVRRSSRPALDHPWRQSERVIKLKQLKNRTFLSWRKPDISTLA